MTGKRSSRIRHAAVGQRAERGGQLVAAPSLGELPKPPIVQRNEGLRQLVRQLRTQPLQLRSVVIRAAAQRGQSGQQPRPADREPYATARSSPLRGTPSRPENDRE
jgi:hypothetical protein